MAPQIITTITGTFTAFLTAIFSALKDGFTSLVTGSTSGTLSDIATWVLVFVGIGICYWIISTIFGIFRPASRV